MLFYDYSGEKILLVCPQSKSGSINLPEDTTKIGNYAFYNCKSVTSITIPDQAADFESNIFDGCENIKVTYKGKTYDYEHIDDLYKAINGN